MMPATKRGIKMENDVPKRGGWLRVMRGMRVLRGTCGEHVIDGVEKKILPEEWAASMSGFFSDIGMTPYNGPWVLETVRPTSAGRDLD
jgi:hypothetical protein